MREGNFMTPNAEMTDVARQRPNVRVPDGSRKYFINQALAVWVLYSSALLPMCILF